MLINNIVLFVITLIHSFSFITGLMEGTVKLEAGGGYVARQMWNAVSKSIAYSSNLMKVLFETIGATKDEISPFCREFSSLDELRDVLIDYLPRTFKYGNASGKGSEEEEAVDVVESVDPAVPTQEAVMDRIRRFASEMGKADDKDDEDNDDAPLLNDDASAAVAATSTASATVNSHELMNLFRAILRVTSADDLMDKVLAASSCLEGKDNVQGAVSLVRKARSLVERWLAKPLSSIAEDGTEFVAGDSLIERDVIVLANVKIGRGASASTVTLPFRVVDVYDKHYNKWYMSKSKSPVKNWKKEPKPFKLKIRMLEKDAINEYCDTGLCGSEYKKEDICKIIEDSMIVGVVGKLQNIA